MAFNYINQTDKQNKIEQSINSFDIILMFIFLSLKFIFLSLKSVQKFRNSDEWKDLERTITTML
ncbi:hypothetical protein BpHYR1_027476 [Brachionus plicatilis]|uniref:Uncharacterized protein n=1 Tax=Brachionus plicatilis TaxID=10195 RepID=A0A3M7SP30_BRAPC|nr:hypothetical protein BpHYR1_027476 [Brachionus plicatilis]